VTRKQIEGFVKYERFDPEMIRTRNVKIRVNRDLDRSCDGLGVAGELRPTVGLSIVRPGIMGSTGEHP
jgi:hypothetical protein